MLVLLSVIGLKSRLIIRNTYMDLFYIPPNSGQQIWEELEQSIDLALNSNHAIIITGDFNINQLDNNTTKTDNLLAQFSFHQLITEPTYVTERSSSLLDLVLVNNPHSILYSEVGPPLLDQNRYHMPIIGVLNHPIKSHSSYKRKVFYIRQG
jgi:endonuclease/exonuclease/phosphatase family metal-dependent hydrolase